MAVKDFRHVSMRSCIPPRLLLSSEQDLLYARIWLDINHTSVHTTKKYKFNSRNSCMDENAYGVHGFVQDLNDPSEPVSKRRLIGVEALRQRFTITPRIWKEMSGQFVALAPLT